MSLFEKQKKTKKKKGMGVKKFISEQHALIVGIHNGNFKHIDKYYVTDKMGTLILKKLPSNKELKKNHVAFKGKVEYKYISKQFRPLINNMVLNNLAKMVDSGVIDKKSNLRAIESTLFGFSPYCDDYNPQSVWRLHSELYRLGLGRIKSIELLEKYSSEIKGNIETPGIVLNSIMTMAYQLTTTKKHKGVFMKHLDKFDSKDIAKAISKLGKETRQTLKRTGVIDPMAKVFLDVKIAMPDKGMTPDEKFGYKIFLYGLYILRSGRIEKLVFKYL